MNYKEFIEKNCKTCNNKNTYLCHIVVNENGKLQCVYRETKKRILRRYL